MTASCAGAACDVAAAGSGSATDPAHADWIVIFATFVPTRGREREVQRALQAVLPPTRREPGCLRFDLCTRAEPVTTFHLFEIFVSQQAVDAHRDTDHYRVYRATVMPLLQTPPVVVRMAPLDVAHAST